MLYQAATRGKRRPCDSSADTIAMIVSDNSMNTAEGSNPIQDWSPDLRAGQKVITSTIGEEIGHDNGAAVIGNPLRTVVWLAKRLPPHGELLPAGEVGTTNHCTDM